MARLSHRTAPGCTYFVTTKTSGNRGLFQVAANAEIVLAVLQRHREAGAYLLHEFVLVPNHLHLLLTPGPVTTVEKAVQLIKGGSSYEIHKRREHRMEIWQAGFFDRTIRDAEDFQSKAYYIRLNPVEAKLVEKPEEWPYSSTHRGFAMDEWPPGVASGAEAPATGNLNLSELKLRPPKAKPPDAESFDAEPPKARTPSVGSSVIPESDGSAVSNSAPPMIKAKAAGR